MSSACVVVPVLTRCIEVIYNTGVLTGNTGEHATKRIQIIIKSDHNKGTKTEKQYNNSSVKLKSGCKRDKIRNI